MNNVELRNAIVEDMISDTPAGIAYWAENMEWDADNAGALTINFTHESASHTITTATFKTAANKWADWASKHFAKDSFQYNAASAWRFNLDELDYDAETLDMIVQFMVFGKVIYS